MRRDPYVPRCVASDNHEEVSKPLPGGSFEACVRRFEDDPEVDDPEALCGFLESQKDNEIVNAWDPEEDTLEDLVDALSDPEAEEVLQNLQVTYVSGVANPAQDSQWVMAKDADARGADWGVNAPLLLRKGTLSMQPTPDEEGEDEDEEPDADDEGGEEEQKAWAPVLIPNETDKQGDVIPPMEIEQAAHNFLANFRKIDTDHDLMEGKGVPIESWTLKQSTEFSLPNGEETREYPAGTWMLGVQFNDEAWGRVKSGELQGFSIYGEAEEIPVEEILGIETETVERTAGAPVSLGDVREVHAIAKSTNESLRMSDNETDETEGEEAEDALESIKSTVEENNTLAKEAREDLNSLQKSHEELEERVEDLEEAEKDEESNEESEEAEAEKEGDEDEEAELPEEAATKEDLEALKEDVEDVATGAAGDAAEAAVKSVLGIDEALPEDEEERREVVRKGLIEAESDGTDGLTSPDEWSEDDVGAVFGGGD